MRGSSQNSRPRRSGRARERRSSVHQQPLVERSTQPTSCSPHRAQLGVTALMVGGCNTPTATEQPSVPTAPRCSWLQHQPDSASPNTSQPQTFSCRSPKKEAKTLPCTKAQSCTPTGPGGTAANKEQNLCYTGEERSNSIQRAAASHPPPSSGAR